MTVGICLKGIQPVIRKHTKRKCLISHARAPAVNGTLHSVLVWHAALMSAARLRVATASLPTAEVVTNAEGRCALGQALMAACIDTYAMFIIMKWGCEL